MPDFRVLDSLLRYGGSRYRTGDVVDLPEDLGDELAEAGRVEPVESEEPKPRRRRRRASQDPAESSDSNESTGDSDGATDDSGDSQE